MSALLRWFGQPAVVRIARWAIGGVFVLSALGKIGDVVWFAQQVHNFRIAPLWAENGIALALPWVELVAGVALLIGPRARAGAVVAFACMAVFTLAVAAAWARGLDFRCGCFGKAVASTVGASKFFENLGLTLLAAIASRRAGPAE